LLLAPTLFPIVTSSLAGLTCRRFTLHPVGHVLVGCLLALHPFGPAFAAEAGNVARDIEQQFRRGDPAKAQQQLTQALALQPADAELRFLRAVILSETGHEDAAVSLFERLTQEFPDLPEPYNNLAVLQAASGRVDEARALLEMALRLDPGYRKAHENLGDVYVRLARRAYEAAAGPLPEAGLQTKLRLTRELAATR
jgi:Flp pilus assembly protein TadD